MAVDWVGAKPGIFINNSVVTPIDQDNLNSIVNTIDKIAQGGTDSGLDAETLQGKSLDSLITPSDESLVNFYSFDALCNTSPCQIDDNSGNQKYGTAYNVTPVKGVIGLAGSFNGTTSYATGSYLNLSALTISFWYKGSLNATNKPLFILKKASNATKIGIYNNNKYVKVIFTDADGVVQNFSDTDQLDAEFHQITVSHTGTKCSIYIDGILKISLSQTLTSLYYNEWVAGANETQDNFSQMILDDIRIYNKALSDEEIYGQYITKIGAKVDSIVPKYINDTFVKLTTNETIAGIKIFSSSPIVPTATTSTQASNYGQVVKNSGDETIAGTKTFSTSPIVPTPSYDSDTTVPATTAWVTDRIEGLTVDCTSRVAEYTGDGIPLIPDNVAGRTYFQDEWVTTDGWGGGSTSSVSVANGKLIITANQSSYYCAKFISSSNKMFSVRVKVSKAGVYRLDYTSNLTIKTFNLLAGVWTNIEAYVNDSISLISVSTSTGAVGDTIEIDWAYIGTGAYDTPALDRAGNGNNLTLNAVTQVNGKYCKEMSFNGVTSYAQASSPVIGTTGTVAVRFKRSGGIGSLQYICNNLNSSVFSGLSIRITSGNILSLIIGGLSSNQQINSIATVNDTNTYHTLVIAVDSTNIYTSFDGGAFVTTALTVTPSVSSTNLNLGCFLGPGLFFNGIISHFRYDSRIWTADEARAWSLNPISIDSSV